MRALERAPWSLRHDLVVPGAIVIGLWIAGGVYYAQHTFAGGALPTPDRAVAAAVRTPCIASMREADRTDGWRASLVRDRWVVHKEFYHLRLLRRHLDANAYAELDAATGRVLSCGVGVVD